MAEESVDKPISKQVNLSPAARRVLDRVKEDFGVSQLLATERGLEFLLTLPPAVLQEVFRKGGDPVGVLVRMKMAEQAGAADDATAIEQAAAIARQQVDRLERIASAFRRELNEQVGGDTSKGKKKSGKGGG